MSEAMDLVENIILCTKYLTKADWEAIKCYFELLIELDVAAAWPLEVEQEASVDDAAAGDDEAEPATGVDASLNEPGAKLAFATDLGGILDATHWRYASICSTQRLSLYCTWRASEKCCQKETEENNLNCT